MTPVSHALIPICLGRRWIPQNDGAPSWRMSLLVAFSGVLPDLLSPHLRLDARHGAFSHSLVAWGCFCVVAGVICAMGRRRGYAPVAWLCVFAYGAHIGCDAITGGVGLFLPFSDSVWGWHMLPFWMWSVSDLILALYVYFIHRWVPLRRKVMEARDLARRRVSI